MRTSAIVVSSTFLLAGLSAAFPVGGGKLVARSADSDFTGIEARAYDEEPALRDPPNNRQSPSHHPHSFYEQSHSELTRRRDPPLPPGFPYVRSPEDWVRNLDRWDSRRQYQSHAPQDSSQQRRPPTPVTPSSPRSPSPSHSGLTRRRDPPLPPGFPSGDWVRHLDAWDTRREHQNRPPSPQPSSPTHQTSSPPPSPRYRRAFYDLD